MTFHIALCDDEIDDLKHEEALIKNVLPDKSKWEFDTFSNSADMLASDKVYQMVFLDVEMDGINGIETAERIHKKEPLYIAFLLMNVTMFYVYARITEKIQQLPGLEL